VYNIIKSRADRVIPEKLGILTSLLHILELGAMIGDSTMSKQIPLTQGKFAIVDDADYLELMKYKWYAHNLSGVYYADRAIRRNNKVVNVSMHRQIMGAQFGQQIDHKNGNGLDNRRCNLRFSTQQQNVQSQRPTRGGTSKYKGVSWIKQYQKWYACIKCNGKNRNLGYFDNEMEAAKVYDEKAKELFGEFAKTNF